MIEKFALSLNDNKIENFHNKIWLSSSLDIIQYILKTHYICFGVLILFTMSIIFMPLFLRCIPHFPSLFWTFFMSSTLALDTSKFPGRLIKDHNLFSYDFIFHLSSFLWILWTHAYITPLSSYYNIRLIPINPINSLTSNWPKGLSFINYN